MERYQKRTVPCVTIVFVTSQVARATGKSLHGGVRTPTSSIFGHVRGRKLQEQCTCCRQGGRPRLGQSSFRSRTGARGDRICTKMFVSRSDCGKNTRGLEQARPSSAARPETGSCRQPLEPPARTPTQPGLCSRPGPSAMLTARSTRHAGRSLSVSARQPGPSTSTWSLRRIE